MKKAVGLFLVFVFGASLLFSGEAQARRKKNMREFFDEQYITKAYVADVINSSENAKVDTAGLKSAIEEALVLRKSHKFEITPESDAVITINIDVVKYVWTETDPIDMVFSPIAAAADAAKADHYVRMDAVVTVVSAKKGKKLWSDNLQAAITHATMTEEEAPAVANKRMVEVFLRELFRKPKRR